MPSLGKSTLLQKIKTHGKILTRIIKMILFVYIDLNEEEQLAALIKEKGILKYARVSVQIENYGTLEVSAPKSDRNWSNDGNMLCFSFWLSVDQMRIKMRTKCDQSCYRVQAIPCKHHQFWMKSSNFFAIFATRRPQL